MFLTSLLPLDLSRCKVLDFIMTMISKYYTLFRKFVLIVLSRVNSRIGSQVVSYHLVKSNCKSGILAGGP